MKKVAIIDYGMGNLRSVRNAVNKVGGEGHVTSDPERIKEFEHVILPGVGAFKEAMENLRGSGMGEVLDAHVSAGKPLMGVCLGMQLMCRDSLEDGNHVGFGWIDAHVVPLKVDETLKIPHIGWNAVSARKAHKVVEGMEDGSDVYFVHSYRVSCNDNEDELLVSEYGETFVSGIAKDRLVGLQFHPEKSQAVGLNMLTGFLEL